MFNRARVVERREQQYKEAEGERNEKEKVTAPEKQDKTAPKAKESSANKTSDSGVSHERGRNSQRRDVQCNYCHRFRHIAKYCRKKLKKNAEASGKSTGNTPKALATTAELSDEQLEEEIAKRRLGKEREMLDTTGSVQVVTGKAIGPTMVVDVEVEGVLVSAVVDTGSQSTIVLRPFLHKVKRYLEGKGKAMPESSQVRLPTERVGHH